MCRWVTVCLSGLIRHQADFIGVGEKTISDMQKQTNRHTNTWFHNSSLWTWYACIHQHICQDLVQMPFYTSQIPQLVMQSVFLLCHLILDLYRSKSLILIWWGEWLEAWGHSETVLLLLTSFLRHAVKDFGGMEWVLLHDVSRVLTNVMVIICISKFDKYITIRLKIF